MSLFWPFAALGILILALFLIERRFPAAVTLFEENVLALLLATITIVSFFQVIARYGFNSGWGGALELTRILFAWLILFGMSYGIKMNLHLGVDALIRLLPEKLFRIVAIFGGLAVLIYAAMLLSADWTKPFGGQSSGGAVHYWAKFYKAGIGLDDLRYPEWIQHAFGMQERVQRWVAYLMLPIGLALLAYRALQATFAIITGKRELIIAGHEAEDLVAENKDILKD